MNKDRLFSSMAKKQGAVCQLAVQLFYDSVGSIDSNQVLWYNWLFSVLWYFSHQVPSVSEGWQIWICETPVLWYYEKDIVRYFESGSITGYFGWCCAGWNGIGLLLAPCVCCSSKHLVVSMGCIYWQYTCGAVQKRGGRLVVMLNIMLKFIQLLCFSNWGNVGFYSMIPDQLWNSGTALWRTETF